MEDLENEGVGCTSGQVAEQFQIQKAPDHLTRLATSGTLRSAWMKYSWQDWGID